MEETWIEMKAFCLKILMPALIGVSVRIAILSRNNSVTILQVIISFVTGVGSAYVFSGLIMETFSDSLVPIWIAVVAICGEKIGAWAVYKLNIEKILQMLIDQVRGK